MKNMKRRFDEKTVGLDLLVHKELKLLAKEKNLQMKDLIMNIMTAYITTKNQAKKSCHRQPIKQKITLAYASLTCNTDKYGRNF